MEEGLIEFHQYFRRSKNRRKGIVYAIVIPGTKRIGIGWSMCNHARGDVFDAVVGRDIARRRALKGLHKQDQNTTITFFTSHKLSGCSWQVHGVDGKWPDTLAPSMSKLVDRIRRVMKAVEDREACHEAHHVQSDPSPPFVGDDDHAKGQGSPIFNPFSVEQ